MHQYWAYGLLVESEIEFPELLPYQFEKADVTIHIGKTPEALSGEDVVHRVRVSISPNEYLLKLLNIANYYATNGNTITIEPLQDGDEKSVRLFALSNAFAAILYQRNLIPLHASGIFYKDGVVLFCGESGSGKSTTVTALQQKGYKVFTDDVCVLQQQNDGSVTVVPSYPMIKLWEDSYSKIGIKKSENQERIREELPKYANFNHNTFSTIPQNKIISLFILECSNIVNGTFLSSINGIEAFEKLQKNIYRPLQLNGTSKRPLVFKAINAALQKTPVYKCERLKYTNTLDKLTNLIEEKILLHGNL